MKRRLFLFCFIFLSLFSFSQVKDSLVKDSLKLPFAISEEERLSDEDLKNKKEGIYLTGVPDLSSDPENGFGAGAEAQLFFDGKRTDPFFAYTAYRAEIDLSAFYTTKSEREIQLVWDIPYIFNSKWRLRGQCEYMVNPNYLFFGTTEETLNPLTSDPNDNFFYNTFQQQEESFNISMEHSWFKSKIRTLVGYELAGDVISTPLNDNSLLHQEAMDGLIAGFGNDRVTLLQLGIIYDTRDLEPDPSTGSFAELTNELATPVLGSQHSFNRTFFHYNYYHRVLTGVFQKLVFAARIGLGNTSGNAPFYEYMDQWSSEGDINGLGGPQTLRGYVQSRFIGPVMGLANIELRCRFLQADILKQHLAFSVIPFFDLGGVWNSLNRITYLKNIRYAEGPGMQISWNEDTILRFDYGASTEGTQFYFGIGQIF
jgi:outer membrane protein assembly factor BamA